MYDKIYEKIKLNQKAYIAPHGKVEFLLHASRWKTIGEKWITHSRLMHGKATIRDLP